jgi:iron complex transport system substrate-binding protein
MKRFPPERIVCLTEETVETLYLLGEQNRIVGVTGFAVRPKGVRQEKPRVSAFTSADIGKITALTPDLVLTFSDLQADIAAELLRAGITVVGYNQRDVAGILAMIEHLGAMVGKPEQAQALTNQYRGCLDEVANRAQCKSQRPLRVYFEEWDSPLISGIGWVSELIEIAGGCDVFADRAAAADARSRIIEPTAVIDAAPEVILASWCGKKVRSEHIAGRDGWQAIPAVQNNQITEIKSPLILQPGPAALTEGLAAIRSALAAAGQ